MAIQQKGANGLIAEYMACETVSEQLALVGRLSGPDSLHFRQLRLAAEQRVGNELSAELIDRARRQGTALGNYVLDAVQSDPSKLGLSETSEDLSSARIEVRHVGYNTNSGVPEDILLSLEFPNGSIVKVPISCKAYKSGTVSLGSKSATAALGRLFANKERIKQDEFIRCFGSLGHEMLSLITLFKDTAAAFYESEVSNDFIDAYERRKGTRKVNNPLRRKEVGQYFYQQYGYFSEHRFADLFRDIFNSAFVNPLHSDEDNEAFVSQLRFIFANPEVLALNAVAETATSVVRVDSSLQNPAYRDLNYVLHPGLRMRLVKRKGTANVGVEISRGSRACSALSLAVWKDATIQFKLHA